MKNHLIEILTTYKTESDISKIMNDLSTDIVNAYIDEIVSNYSFSHNIIHIKNNGMNIEDKNHRQSKRLISVLSNNEYYKEKIVNLNKNDHIVIKNNDFSMVKKLKVNTKEDFFKVLKMFRCQDFVLLNFENFDFNQSDLEKFKLYCSSLKINRKISKTKKIKFIEKTNLLYPIFYDLDLYEKFDQEEYDLFKSIFHNKNLNITENIGRILTMVFLHKINLEVDKINKEIYLDFFKEHTHLIKEIEKFILESSNNASFNHIFEDKNLINLIGLAEKLICEDQLRSF